MSAAPRGFDRRTVFVISCAVAMLSRVGLTAPPRIGSSPDEPTWAQLLNRRWGLDVDRDLRNPRQAEGTRAGVFRRADQTRPVVLKPIIALGLETTTRGGWYPTAPRASLIPKNLVGTKREVWSFAYKAPKGNRYYGGPAPRLASGGIEFDPGNGAFGLWVGNDQFSDVGVFTQPGLNAVLNDRLRAQPCKTLIYPNRHLRTGRLIEHSYLIAWEYSGDDDFQDVITQIDNVKLLPADPALPGILAPVARIRKLAGGFKFLEGPAWNRRNEVLYFSDVTPAHIMRYANGSVTVSNSHSRSTNGLMFDRQGWLLACERQGRRISRTTPGRLAANVVSHYQGRRFNSPKDLWLDTHGGIYFTDPCYGPSDTKGVYYVAVNGTITRIIDDLIKPSGIALSPDGQTLYVSDPGTHTLHRYRVISPGAVTQGQRIAYVTAPGGMTVDVQGRLYVAGEGGIWVLERNGKWVGMIETLEQPSNCTFGGPALSTLFVTARTSLLGIETLTTGWHVHLDGVLSRGSF